MKILHLNSSDIKGGAAKAAINLHESLLNENIESTTVLIGEINTASEEQRKGIEQINDSVANLDKQTQEIASIASQTNEVAANTDRLAKEVVENANEKEFEGK